MTADGLAVIDLAHARFLIFLLDLIPIRFARAIPAGALRLAADKSKPRQTLT